MLGNFSYCNPTKLYFGDESLSYLKDELKKYGNKVLLVYGGGSIKKIGLYDEVINILKQANKEIFFDSGVMPNPTLEKLYEGIKIAKDNNIDFILAVGGGSVIDYSKALSASIYCKEDPWERYYEKMLEPNCKIVPMGCVLTMVGTGSEMNGGAVITNTDKKLKIGHVFNEEVFPKFAILNPKYTYSLPHYQMVAGIFDIFSHIMEQYFSDFDDNTSDYIMEGLMNSLINSSLIANKDPLNYEARSNIMWIATWALNTLVAKGKTTDWKVHMIGQQVGAFTNATHGMTLSAVSIPYYRYILKDGLFKFKRFAINVFKVDPKNKSDEEIANEGLNCLLDYMKTLNLVLSIKELGVKEDMINDIANSCFCNQGGYKTLNHDDIKKILLESYNQE